MGDDRPGLQLRDYLSVVRRRKWVLLFVILVVCGSALAASLLQTPIYEARTRVLLEQKTVSIDGGFDYVQPSRVETELQIVNSQAVQAEVQKRLGRVVPVTAAPVGATAVIEIIAESSVPAQAAKIADTYAESYIEVRRGKTVGGLLSAAQQLQRNLEEVNGRIADSVSRGADPLKPTPELQAMLSQRELIAQKLDQLEVSREFPDGGSHIIGPARVPTVPIRPTPVRNGILGAAVGLVFGLALVFLWEHLDDSVKGEEDLHRAAPDVRMLGTVPLVSTWKNRSEPFVVSLAEPSSPAAEAYRTIRTSIRFMGLDRPLRTLLVTSAMAGEGKTTTVANLALALSRAGQRVTIISCDLRRPRIHEFFGLSNSVGFTSVLLGEVQLGAALQLVPKTSRIQLLAAGPIPPNPSELLSSQRALDTIAALQAHSDVVLIDAPPVLPVTDAAVLSPLVDGTLLVTTAGLTGRRQVSKASRSLRQVGGRLVGVILNGVRPQGDYSDYGYYAYGPAAGRTETKAEKKAEKRAERARKKAAGAGVEQTA